ncbi:transcriptional regulator [Erwiniaceae bacterium CAU 1747]
MFSTEECIEILNHNLLELSEGVIVNCDTNTLDIASRQLSVTLNESQKRLLVCLIKKIYNKRDIINIVWYENHQRISDNNYHQLTFQLRALLHRNNLPDNLLVTVPYYGLKLNESQWKTLAENQVKDLTPVKPIAVVENTSTDNENMVKDAEEYRGNIKQGRFFLTEQLMRASCLSQPSLAQNTFILCMFVALALFI